MRSTAKATASTRLTRDELRLIQKLRTHGCGVKTIARELGRPESTIEKAVVRVEDAIAARKGCELKNWRCGGPIAFDRQESAYLCVVHRALAAKKRKGMRDA